MKMSWQTLRHPPNDWPESYFEYPRHGHCATNLGYLASLQHRLYEWRLVFPLGTLQCRLQVLLCRIQYTRRQRYVALPLEADSQERVRCTHLLAADERRQSRPNQILRDANSVVQHIFSKWQLSDRTENIFNYRQTFWRGEVNRNTSAGARIKSQFRGRWRQTILNEKSIEFIRPATHAWLTARRKCCKTSRQGNGGSSCCWAQGAYGKFCVKLPTCGCGYDCTFDVRLTQVWACPVWEYTSTNVIV